MYVRIKATVEPTATDLCSWMIEFSQAPVNEAQSSRFVVDHHVVWLHVAMHNAVGVSKVKSLYEVIPKGEV